MRRHAYHSVVISLPASPVRPGADPAASRPGTRLPALASGLGLLALGLVTLIVLTFAPARDSLASPGATYRPALVVMTSQPASVEAPLLHRLDRDVTAVAAADIEPPLDPALPGEPAQVVPTLIFVTAPFRETSASLPRPAPLASPLRPPRAA